MTIQTYSLKTDGVKKLSKDFTVKEFACKDGSNTVKVDTNLVNKLQQIRDYFNTPVVINSAYRTKDHNNRVGGSPNSQHLKGTAADICVKNVTPLKVAQYAEYIGFGGVGLYDGFTHVDVRATKSKWDYRNGARKNVISFGEQEQFAVSPYRAKVKERFGFNEATLDYLEEYKFGESLMKKLATKD